MSESYQKYGKNEYTLSYPDNLSNRLCSGKIILVFFLYFETRVLFKWIRFYVEAAENCVKHWYSEEKNYKYKTPESPDNKRFASQFTQLVWNSSSELGGGITYYQYYEDVIFHCVALYYPEGNIKGSYGANVFCKLTEPNCKKKVK